MRRALSLWLLVALLAGCRGGASGPSFDRNAMLHELGEVVIVPGYRAARDRSVELADASHALCESPSEATLDDARTRWREALVAWNHTLAGGIGPAIDEHLADGIELFPTRPELIEAAIAEATLPIAPADIDALGASAKGLLAIEYLLFADDALTLLEGETRCAFLVALGDDLVMRTTRLHDAWAREGGAFVVQLETAGRESTVYREQRTVISLLVTRLLSTVELVRLTKLGVPLGRRDMSMLAHPEEVESRWGEGSVAAMRADLEGLRAIWLCSDGSSDQRGIEDYVRVLDPELADRVTMEIDAALAAIDAVPEPLAEHVSGATTEADAAYEALRVLGRSIGADVAATLGITVSFTDADGD